LEDPEQSALIKSSDNVLARYGKLVTIVTSVFFCLLIFFYLAMRGFPERNLTFGKWKMKAENHQYILIDEDVQMLVEEG